MNKDSSVFVAGERGLAGSAIRRALAARGFTNIVSAPRSQLDLRDAAAVDRFFAKERPAYEIGRAHV